MEEVRSGAPRSPEAHAPVAGGGLAWWRIDELGRRHETAVLAWESTRWVPLALRVPDTRPSATGS